MTCSVLERRCPKGCVEPTASPPGRRSPRVASCAQRQPQTAPPLWLLGRTACRLSPNQLRLQTPPADHSGLRGWLCGRGTQTSQLILHLFLTGGPEPLGHFFSPVGRHPRFGSSFSVLVADDSKGHLPPKHIPDCTHRDGVCSRDFSRASHLPWDFGGAHLPWKLGESWSSVL